MRYLFFIITVFGLFYSCNSQKQVLDNQDVSEVDYTAKNDTITISNDELEYEIIIIDPGFNSWLISTAKPEGYYSQSFLESRNILFVTAWNQRVLQPRVYNPNLYELEIDYEQGIDYGYHVNYMLYNYFIYFQLKYKQQLTGFVPRI